MRVEANCGNREDVLNDESLLNEKSEHVTESSVPSEISIFERYKQPSSLPGSPIHPNRSPKKKRAPWCESYAILNHCYPLEILRIRTNEDPYAYCQFEGIDADFLLPCSSNEATLLMKDYFQVIKAKKTFEGNDLEFQDLQRRKLMLVRPDNKMPRIGVSISDPPKLKPDHINKIIQTIHQSGGRPVLILPILDCILPNDPDVRANAIAAMASSLDGFIGPGGVDIAPVFYGAKNKDSIDTNLQQDVFEGNLLLALLLQRHAFVLGICRTHQLIHALGGGAMIQDLQKEGYVIYSHTQKDFGIPNSRPFVLRKGSMFHEFEHRVRLARFSRLASIAGADSIVTNSFHHQAVLKAPKELEVVGDVYDMFIKKEISEASEAWNVLTCQWHPEFMEDDPVSRRLMATVSRRGHIFHYLRQKETHRKQVTRQSLEKWMLVRRCSEACRFTPSDFRWVRDDLFQGMGDRASEKSC